MKDGTGAGEPAEVSRQDLYEEYVNCFLQLCPEVRPCRDEPLLRRAARYLQREPEPAETFTVFPFYRAVIEGSEALSTDCRRHLRAFIRATELLETLCVNLLLQPWRREIRTLKTFTGPFVYCLLPVLSSSTLRSVLASIGYLPNTDATQSEFRLSEDANADRAMLVGFELLLARLECVHLLELVDRDHLGPQECLQVLQRRVQPAEPTEHVEKKKTTTGQEVEEGEEEEEEEEEEERKKEELDKNEVPLYLDSSSAVNPVPKPQRSHLFTVDQSIMEMQQTYPDLAFRGRPLLTDKPRRAHSGSKAICPDRDSGRRSRAADSDATCVDSEGGLVADGTGGTEPPGDELSGPQWSLHITLRAGPQTEQSLKPGETQTTTESPAWSLQQHEGVAKAETPSQSSMEEDQDLRALAERMSQVSVETQDKDEVKRKQDKRGDENTGKDRRKKLKKSNTETDPALSQEARRRTRSSTRSSTREQQQPAECQTDRPPDRQGCRGDGSRGQQEGGQPEAEETFQI
ncbi:uncharacterized protein [Embiotoca jacksoni]|uniref:uncharacterized protein n=1 Tax=Embiotoca jacksoni TaxID=100190 RepID=UPI003704715A